MTSHYDPAAEPTIWRLPDELWEECCGLLPLQKAPGTPGRPVVPSRRVLDGILYVLRTGCQWKATPPEFGSGSTCHRRFQEWVEDGTWERLWADQLERYDAEQGIGWDGQSADSATVPSPPGRGRDRPRPHQSGQTGHQAPRAHRPPGRAAGRRDQRGQPQRHESGRGDPGQRRGGTPQPTPAAPQHLCRDKGFDFPETRQAAEARGYIVHTPPKVRKGADPPPPPPEEERHPARRWVVERTNSWHNRFRKLRIRYEKKAQNYLGLVHIACFLIVYRLRAVLG